MLKLQLEQEIKLCKEVLQIQTRFPTVNKSMHNSFFVGCDKIA